VVERINRMLGDAIRSLLLGRSQEEWDTMNYRKSCGPIVAHRTPVLVRPLTS